MRPAIRGRRPGPPRAVGTTTMRLGRAFWKDIIGNLTTAGQGLLGRRTESRPGEDIRELCLALLRTKGEASKVYLVRHGETPLNVARILQHPDTPLSERCAAALRHAVGKLIALNPVRCLACCFH